MHERCANIMCESAGAHANSFGIGIMGPRASAKGSLSSVAPGDAGVTFGTETGLFSLL